MDSIRAPFSSEVIYSGVIQLEVISATTGKPALTGTALKIPTVNFLTDEVLLFDLVGNKTVATTISGIRAIFTAIPTPNSGWEQVAPWGIRKVLKTPQLLPAGKFIGCRYDMPAQKFIIESLATTTWTTLQRVVSVLFGDPVKQAKIITNIAKGNLKCVIGVKAIDILPTVVIIPPPPVVTPPVPPDPTGLSPDGSVLTAVSGKLLITKEGTWTFGTSVGAGGNYILLNGAQAASGEATELNVLNGGNLYAFNSFGNWFQWVGTSWNRLTTAPAGALHP